jgi:hypothetical protein
MVGPIPMGKTPDVRPSGRLKPLSRNGKGTRRRRGFLLDLAVMESPAPGRVADKPHRLTLVLSTAAVLVSLGSASLSYLSLQETRENRRITEQTSRAYLRIVSFLLETPIVLSEKNWSNKLIRASITITNTGRVAANNVDALVDLNPPRAENLFSIARFEEIPPGSSVTTTSRILLGNEHRLTFSNDTKEYSISVKVDYDAGLNEGRRMDEVFFCVPPPPKNAKGLTVLSPCDTHFERESFK